MRECPTSPAPLVSLLVLTCNRHEFLRLALRSAARQTYPNIEVVIVDDGDKPLKKPYHKEHRMTVRLIRLSKPRSIGNKRNAGVRAASGAVLIHWDDDDLHDRVKRDLARNVFVSRKKDG